MFDSSSAPEPSRRSLRFHPLSLLVGLCLIAFWLFYSHAPRGIDFDLGWHLKAGQLMLAGHSPIWTDDFSWTAAGRPWVDHEWLGETAFAALDQLGGYPAIANAYWGMLLLNFALILMVFLRSGCPFCLSSFASLAIGFQLFWQLWPRMQGFTILGLSATMLVLQGWWMGKRPRWLLLAYPAGVALWVNLHGGAIAGPLSLLMVLLIELPFHLKRRDFEPLRYLGILLSFSCLALLVNPYGVELIRSAVSPLVDPTVRAMNRLVDEWSPFDFRNRIHQISLVWFAGLLLLATLNRKRVALGSLLLMLAWAAMGLMSQRNLSLAAIASAPFAARALAGFAAGFGDKTRTERWTLGALGLALAGVLFFNSTTQFLLKRGYLSNAFVFPSPPSMQALRSLPSAPRLLNDYSWGGLIILEAYPSIRVFIDGRQYVYGQTINEDYLKLMSAAPGWQGLLASYGIDTLYAPPDAPLVMELQKDPVWRTYYQDESAVILKR